MTTADAPSPAADATPALHTTSYGTEGARVAFCHGLFGQGRNWTRFAKDLAADHRVLLLDMPNHGRSAHSDHFDYADAADLVAGQLRCVGGDDTWQLVGHSMGGKIAMLVALRHPELVERLCVVDISPVTYPPLREIDGYAQAMRAVELDTLQERGGRRAAEDDLRAEVPSDTIRGFLLQNLRRDDDRWRWQMNLAMLVDHMSELAGWPDLDPTQYRYEGPVLWVAGAQSRYIRPEHGEIMRRYFPRTRLMTIKNAGHWVHSEQPEIFASALRRFLDG